MSGDRPRLTSAELQAAMLVNLGRWAEMADGAAQQQDIEEMRAAVMHLAGNLRNSRTSLEMLLERVKRDKTGD